MARARDHEEGEVALGYDWRLYVMAFDHRGSFERQLFGLTHEPSSEESARIADAKAVIYEGLRVALDAGVRRDAAAVLVDEQFGAAVARAAKTEGVMLAMPVERSGQDEFDFQYGRDFGAHIEAFQPDFAKVLVRYNTEGDADVNRRQAARLRRLADWLHARGRRFLFELLVPATPAQLASVGGQAARYDAELRPSLMVGAIAQLQAAGAEADVWKIEGLDRRSDCASVVAQARSGGRDGVACVVLGRGAEAGQVDAWLRAAAGVPGYLGFAIGRSIWFDALRDWLAGACDRDAATRTIANNYRRFVGVYEDAVTATRR
jgi:myo-inositol catabolism protein IolC